MNLSLSLAALLMGVSLSVAAQPSAPAAGGAQHPPSAAETTSAESMAPGSASEALDPARAQAITKAFESRFPGIHVDGVRATPMQGIFEVQVGMDLLYTDAAVDYVLQGSLIDAKAKRDLTAARLETLQQVAFDTLPLKDAIKIVKGNGSRKLATFEDPNCPYCKQLHHTLAGVDNVTVYVFLFPILAPDSMSKSRDIWCAADPAKAWTDWMVDGKAPAQADCKTPLQANLALGQKLNVQGTPALFFGDGTRVNGALPLASLKQKLDAQGKG
jgi:thiol:disulfide interchange protein DsbC